MDGAFTKIFYTTFVAKTSSSKNNLPYTRTKGQAQINEIGENKLLTYHTDVPIINQLTGGNTMSMTTDKQRGLDELHEQFIEEQGDYDIYAALNGWSQIGDSWYDGGDLVFVSTDEMLKDYFSKEVR